MEYEEFLAQFGTFGWFNVILLILIGTSGMTWYSVNTYVISFVGTRTNHWCYLPQLEDRTQDEQWLHGIPWDAHTGAYSQCSMYGSNSSSDVTASPTEVSCQYGWMYDTSIRQTTYISEWNLVCDNAAVTDLAAPAFMFGQFAGSLVTGSLANMFGRKKTLLLGSTLMCLSCIGCAFSINVYMFIFARFLIGSTGLLVAMSGYMLASEITTSSHREFAATFMSLCYQLGVVLSALFAYFITYWRPLQIATGLGAIPILILFCIIVPESPRWLVWKERRIEAAHIVAKIYRHTSTPPEPHVVKEFTEKRKKAADLDEKSSPVETANFLDMFRNPVTCRTLITLAITWTTITFTLFSVGFNMDNLFGDVYVNMVTLGAVEIVAIAVTPIAMRRFGRIFCFCFIFTVVAVSGFIAVICLSVGVDGMIVTVCAIICRALCTAGNNVIAVYSLEIFPTPIRGHAQVFIYSVCYLLGIVSPYVGGTLADSWAPLPYVCYTALSILTVCLVVWLPETRGKTMPETIQDLENLKRHPKLSDDSHKSETIKDNTMPYKPMPATGVSNQAYIISDNDITNNKSIQRDPANGMADSIYLPELNDDIVVTNITQVCPTGYPISLYSISECSAEQGTKSVFTAVLADLVVHDCERRGSNFSIRL